MNPVSRRAVLQVALLVMLGFSQGVMGQTGTPGSGPIPAGKSGYRIELDLKWPQGDLGIRPVKLRITREPQATSTRDQLFTVTISANNWYEGNPDYRVKQAVMLPAGQTGVTCEIPVDLELMWDYNNGMAEILIESGGGDGRYGPGDLLDIYDSLGAFNPGWRGVAGEEYSWLLVSDAAAPATYDHEYFYWSGMPQNQSPNWIAANASMNMASPGNLPGGPRLFGATASQTLDQPNWMAIRPVDLPDSWVCMTSVDRVLISLPDLERIHSQHPQSRATLAKWVAAGGQLVVYNPDNTLAHADRILALLGEPGQPAPAACDDWVIVRPDKVAEAARIKSGIDMEAVFVNQVIRGSSAADVQDGDDCMHRQYLGGTLCAVSDIDQWDREKMERLEFQLNTHCPAAETPMASVEQRGRSPIPGVGEPPIMLFILFVGAFLLLVGPLMMIVLRSAPSRQYLFFAVPLFSLVTCLGILGYAMVVDYNKQWGRTETLTMLDQQTGLAYTQAVSAYYCGAQPRFYEYDAATVVRTALTDRDEVRVDFPGEERLRLSGSRILARRLHEVFACRAYETDQQLSIQASAEEESGPQVTNRLGGAIEAAVFQFRGKFYQIRDVPNGGQGVGIAVQANDLESSLLESLPVDEARGTPGIGFPFLDGTEVVKLQREIRTGRGQLAGKLNRSGSYLALLRTDPAADALTEPFRYKFKYHLIHGRQ